MKRILAALSMLLAIAFFACDANAADLTVSAALSLKNAFEELGRLYEFRHAGTRVLLNFGASGDLTRQIAGGAPVDVFASAAPKDMNDLENKGYILAGSRIDFARNSVVLIASKNGTIKSFADLTSDRVQRIAAGNPKTVPAGRYAAEVFAYYKIAGPIKDKLIYTDNVRQVLDYAARGEVDAGVVYATDAAIRGTEIRVVAEAPAASHNPVVYPIAIVKGTGNQAAAKSFIDLVLSKEGGAILKKYGFGILR